MDHQAAVEIEQGDIGKMFDAGVPLQGDGTNG